MNISLRIENDGQFVKSLELATGQYTLGSMAADIMLRYPTVSRKHGTVEFTETTAFYHDLGSRNGSILGEKSLQVLCTGERVQWNADVPLRIGPFKLRWHREPLGTRDSTDMLEKLGRLYAKHLSDAPGLAYDHLCKAVEHLEEKSRQQVLQRIHSEFHGNGPISAYLENSDCREILINGHDRIFVDLGEGLKRIPSEFLSSETYEAWASRTAAESGRRLDLQHPICEATLACGARFHAVLPPISVGGVSVSIRRFGAAPMCEERALESGWLDRRSLEILKQAIQRRLNIVISGGTSTGKTSLLNFLCTYLHPKDRVITVEDTIELQPPVENLVQLQARKPNADGFGEISLRSLVQSALRMRPDRIIVGECRGAEVLEMLQALNTGHPGSLTTVHANSPTEALQRLELLALLGAPNLTIECLSRWIASCVHVVVQLERDALGHRHVSTIGLRTNSGGKLETIYARSASEVA